MIKVRNNLYNCDLCGAEQEGAYSNSPPAHWISCYIKAENYKPSENFHICWECHPYQKESYSRDLSGFFKKLWNKKFKPSEARSGE